MKKSLKYLIIATVVLIIFAIIGKKAGWFGKKILVKVSTELVEKHTIIETITASGKVQPETEVKISPDVSGEIVELYIKEGEQVEKGQLLLKIKPDTYISILDRAKASSNSSKSMLAQSKAQLIDKESNYKRNKTLWQQKAISDAEFEAIEAAYKVALANVESSMYSVKSSEASVKEANENLFKTTIYAPMSGTISKLNVEKGERVVGTIQMAGTEMLRIANLDKMEILVDVNENDIVRVHLGDTALVEVDAYLGEKFKGIVTEIANSANTTAGGIATDQVTSFNVKIRLLHKFYKHLIPEGDEFYSPFRPGMSASVDIQTKKIVDVLTVPIQSVTLQVDTSKQENDDYEKKEIVYLYRNDSVFVMPVKTGIQDNNYIQIISGLKLSDEVVSAPYNAITKKLKDKIAVQKVSKEELFIKED